MSKKELTIQEQIQAAAKDGRCKVRALMSTMDDGKPRHVGDTWKMLTQLVGPHIEAGVVELAGS